MLSAAWVLTLSIALQRVPTPPPPSPWTDDRPITHVLQNLGHDFGALPRVDNAVIAGAGVAAAGLLHREDDELATWARSSGYSSYSSAGSVLGDAWVQGGAALGAYVLGKLERNDEVAHIGSDLIRAQVLGGLLTIGLKVTVQRTRPNGGALAFPSGHSAATFASAAVLAEHLGWKVGVPAFAVASFVGWTRVRDDQHWLSDVIFGSAVGLIAGRTVASHGHHTWSIVPATTRGGAAVYLVKTGG